MIAPRQASKIVLLATTAAAKSLKIQRGWLESKNRFTRSIEILTLDCVRVSAF